MHIPVPQLLLISVPYIIAQLSEPRQPRGCGSTNTDFVWGSPMSPCHVPFLFRDAQGFSDHGLRLRQPGEALCSSLVFHGLAMSEEGQSRIVYIVFQFGFIRCPLVF